MNILTDDECREIYNGAMAMPERSVVQTMRVIEAAVLSKLAAGFGDEPTYFTVKGTPPSSLEPHTQPGWLRD